MNTQSAPQTSLDAARALLKQLEEKFPVIREHKALALGIDKQLRTQLQDVDKKTLRIALSLHTNTTQYLKSVEKAAHRTNLDGSPAGEIDEAHRARASEILRERFKKSIERRKAQEQAARAERRRAEKLQQLAEKFSSRH